MILGLGYNIFLLQYFENKPKEDLFSHAAVTFIFFLPSERITASEDLKWASVTNTFLRNFSSLRFEAILKLIRLLYLKTFNPRIFQIGII